MMNYKDTWTYNILNNYYTRKEVKKLRPYFEMEVVKVKKKEWIPDYCPCCGQRTVEKKGNWVNGENLDKIKIPVPCSYVMDNEKKYGMLNRVFFRGEYFYVIINCSQQYVDVNGEPFYHPSNLKTMFENLNIHILKGKIILYEEEK